MPKKIDYASMFTLRADGRYMGYWHDSAGRHAIYDKDPERLYNKITDKETISRILFRDVAAGWEREHREAITDRTWANYEPHYNEILDTHGEKPIEDVTALDIIADLKAAAAQGYSRTIVNTRRSIYSMILDYAVIHGYVPFNAATAVKLPKGLSHGKRRAPTDEEIFTILSSIDAPFGLFPFLLLCTGLRKSEALSLTWDDIDFKKWTISINKSIDYIDGANPKLKCPKTEASMRVIPIVQILQEPLKEQKCHSGSDLLFPSMNSNRSGKGGGIMTERGYEGAWRRYCSAVGFVLEDGKLELTAHNLRHGTATVMFESGVDVYTAQKILGHANIDTTLSIYTELRDKQKDKSVVKFSEKLSALLSKNENSDRKQA